MNAQALAHFPLTWLTCVALLLFFAVFVTMTARVFMRANAPLYRKLAEMPLGDEENRHE